MKTINIQTIGIILLLSLCPCIVACSSQQDNKPAQSAEQVTRDKAEAQSSVTDNAEGDKQQNSTDNSDMNIQENLVEPIDVDQLKLFLPTDVPGTEALPPKKGNRNYGSYRWTTVSKEFVFPDKSVLTFFINDYASKDMIPPEDIKGFDKLPEKQNYLSAKHSLKYGPAYELWYNERKSGDIYYLINNRFLVRILANRIPTDKESLLDFLNFVRIDDLVKQMK